MKISIRYDDFEQADDEVTQTMHYGGFIKINDLRIPASGTDRSWDCYLDIQKGIEQVLGRELTTEEQERLETNEEFMLLEDVDLEFADELNPQE
jgi:hypothetical protein